MAETGNGASQSMAGAYPPATPAQQQPGPDFKAEAETLKQQLEEATTKMKELEDQKVALEKKVTDFENQQKTTLAEQVADVKVSRGLLTKEKRDEEVKKLSALSLDTLQVLNTELSNINVKLSAESAPLAPPANNPPATTPLPAQTPEQERAEKLKQERIRLFGHEAEPFEYFKAQKLEEQQLTNW